MAYNSMSLHPNHMIKGLSCRQEARLQIISLLLSMVLTYTCAIFKTTKHHKTLHQFCGSLYMCYGVRVFPLILRYQIRGIDVLPFDPLIVQVGVSFPLDKVLYLTPTPVMTGINNALHLILLFSIDKVRWRPRVILAMSCHFLIRREKIHMKHQVYLPLVQ